MKVWVLEHVSKQYAGEYWTGRGLLFTQNIDRALQLVRERDAVQLLDDNPMLPAVPAERGLPDGDEPRTQSAADHHGDGGAGAQTRA